MGNKGTKAIIFTLALFVAACLFFESSNTSAQKATRETRNTMRWEHSDDGSRMSVEIEGKAEFTDDYSDIRDVSEKGYVRIEQDRGGQSRRYEVRKNSNGQLERMYFVNGAARPLDQEARAWISRAVLDAVRQSGIDAEKRVQLILKQTGVNGVLDEITLVSSDYAQRIYFQALLKNASLNSADLQRVLRAAAKEISSDYEQAQLLIDVAPVLKGKEGAMPAFFEAAGTIKSDYEHKRVLIALLKDATPNREVLVATAQSAASISSDYEKATVLKAVAAAYLDDRELRSIFFQTVETIKSDYEHRGVLSALLKNAKLSAEVLTGLLASAASLSSDYEKATILMEASNAYASDARLREAFLKVVETIKSDYERGRVLSALLKNKQIG